MNTGRTLKLFLVDGAANGLLTAEIMNWTGHVLVGPRSRLAELIQRPESGRPALYILAGPDLGASLQTEIYIGETSKASRRLIQHNKPEEENGKDFWERACIITSKDPNLTSAHIFHLQGRLIELGRQALRAVVQNVKADKADALPEPDLADMEFFLAQVLTILPVIGMDFFRAPPSVAAAGSQTDPVVPGFSASASATPATVSPLFNGDLKTVGITAKGRQINGEFVVSKGSMARLNWEGVEGGYTALFKELVQASVLAPTPDGRFNIFTRDYAFSSPSAAAAVVSGRNANGRLHWHEDGTDRTYGQWLEDQVKALAPEAAATDFEDSTDAS
ncbi:hypothetical protein RCH10_005468 [Variovorax sp. GrIS 2.14]|uniref:GIY-YIG nuclease family protein n=1 Tax=Variovorax sp. GrIS 2.14 TaxID=3071709 RepID=UPI0038F64910